MIHRLRQWRRLKHWQGLASKCEDDSLAALTSLIAAAAMPNATEQQRKVLEAAAAIFQLAMSKLAYLPPNHEIVQLARLNPLPTSFEGRRLALLMERHRLTVWWDTLTEINLIQRPFCSEASDKSEAFH